MSKDKLDDVRSRLQISDLDQEARKELFGKFQQAGGKIVDLNQDISKIKNVSSKNRNSTNAQTVRGEVYTSNPFATDTTTPVKRPVKESQEQSSTNKVSYKESIFRYYMVRMSCFLVGLFNFTATKFSKKFINMSLDQAYIHNAYIKSTLAALFESEEPNNIAFRDYILEIGMIKEYELVYLAYQLIDEIDFVELKNTMPFSVNSSETHFIKIFRKLAFYNTSRKQMEIAISRIAEQYKEFFQQKIYEFYRHQKITQSFLFLWNEWYLWVDELINYYWVRYNYKTPYLSREEFLQFNKVQALGFFAESWTQDYLDRKEKKEQQQESSTSTLEFPDQNIEKGVLLINKFIDFNQTYQHFKDNKDIRALLNPKDKLFYSYILVDFFDKEFSLIWNEVNFYVDLGGDGRRFDPKKEIKVLSSKLTQFDEMVTEYLRVVRDQKSLSAQGEKEKSQQLNKMSFNARQMLLTVMEQYCALLSKVKSQKDKSNDSIGNWEEIILANKKYEHRLLYGYTVNEIVEFAYGFANAMVWLLKYKDLSGLDNNLTELTVISMKK